MGWQEQTLPASEQPTPQHAGVRGEEAADLSLREIGYTAVGENYCAARHDREIDLSARGARWALSYRGEDS